MVSSSLGKASRRGRAQKRDALTYCRKEPRISPGQRKAAWGMRDYSPGDGVAHDARGAQRPKGLLDGRG